MKRFKSFSRKGATVLKRFLGALLLGGLLAVFAPSAQATLIGQTVGCSASPDSGIISYDCSSDTAVVQNPGKEFTLTRVTRLRNGREFRDPQLTLDIAENSILIEPTGGIDQTIVAPLTVSLSNLFWLGNPDAVITGLLFSVAGVTGFDETDISFSDNGIAFALESGTEWIAGSSATITLVTADGGSTVAVSEPATLALFGFGLAGLGLMGRRKARQPLSSR